MTSENLERLVRELQLLGFQKMEADETPYMFMVVFNDSGKPVEIGALTLRQSWFHPVRSRVEWLVEWANGWNVHPTINGNAQIWDFR